MSSRDQELVREISDLVQAELECARSLKASGIEIEKLIEQGAFEQVRDRIVSRQEVVELLAQLNAKQVLLIAAEKPDLNHPAWRAVKRKSDVLRRILNHVSHTMQCSDVNLTAVCEELGQKLHHLQDGKQCVKSYKKCMKSSIPMASAQA